MTEPSHEQFEAELRSQRPAEPPPELMARLTAARPRLQTIRPRQTATLRELWTFLRPWLAPATAVIAVGLIVWQLQPPAPRAPGKQTPPASVATMKGDDVHIERELVNSFDTIALLPSGEPVRFRCREWLDDVTLHDRAGGLVVEQRTPRVEVVPVRFETY
jgi:hypothetical protein